MIKTRELVLLALAMLVAALGIASMLSSGMVTSLSKDTPVADPMMDYAWGIAFATALGAAILAFPLQLRERVALMTIWCAKILVALVAMLYYESFYVVLDAFSYYEIPKSPAFDPPGFAIGQGTENLYNLVWLLYCVMPESYHALKSVFSFIGLMAVFLCYRAIAAFLGRDDLRVLYFLSLFPSLLFWSTILGKDPLALFAIALYAYGTATWFRGHTRRALALILIGITIAAYVRAWLAPILIAPLLIKYFVSGGSVVRRLAVTALGVAAFVLSFEFLWEQFSIETASDLLWGIDTTARQWAHGGSALELKVDLTRPVELLAAFPLAAFTALFRPLPGEILNVFGLLAGLENTVLLLLLVLAVKRFRPGDLANPTVAWALMFVLVWTVAYAFISYQNLGTAVRFRLQVLPFLLAVLAFFARSPKAGGAMYRPSRN